MSAEKGNEISTEVQQAQRRARHTSPFGEFNPALKSTPLAEMS
jgi:hypothetical protein